MNHIEDVLEKFEQAEEIKPAWDRVAMFSWNDLKTLKEEIERLRHLVGREVVP